MATDSKAPVPSLVIAASHERLLKMEHDGKFARVIELIDSEGSESESEGSESEGESEGESESESESEDSESESDTVSSKRDEEMEQYRQKMRQLGPYDAIARPPHARLYGGVSPYTVTDKYRPLLVKLCNLALKKFNTEIQNAKFEFVKLVKVTSAVIHGRLFYITFEAKNASRDASEDSPNSAPCTFQAKVWDKTSSGEEPKVIECRMKPT